MKKIISFVLVCVMLLGCAFTLCSCGEPDSDPKDAVKSLEKDDYTVTVKENIGGCKTYIYAYYNNLKEKCFDEVEIYYYADEAAAQKAYEAKSKVFEALVEKQDEDYKYEYGIDGALIWDGTKAAIKAAK